MWDLILKAAVSYLEKHPEVVEKLIAEGVQFLIDKIGQK